MSGPVVSILVGWLAGMGAMVGSMGEASPRAADRVTLEVRSPRPAVPQQARRFADSEYGCIVCHAEKRRDFVEGIHEQRGIQCHDCHGGDPGEIETAQAAHRRPFLGDPTKLEIIELCASCHSDPNQMRAYGLPADQVAEMRASRHGQLLFERASDDAPTCTDCHDSHTIRPPEDVRSDVHPTNIITTCAACHADTDMMDRHGLGTDEFSEYMQSAHGTGLFERRNLASPSCISCHGSHSALTTEGTRVADVCGQCHVLARDAFYSGPHGPAALAGDMPGCLGCHSNHGTERTSMSEIAVQCEHCHESGSEALALGIQIQERVTVAQDNLQWAEEAVHELVRAGREVFDTRFRLISARTAFGQIGPAQHSLDVDALEDLARQVRTISRGIRDQHEVSEEHRWEHKLMLILIWFLALSACLLAWFRLRAVRE
jgi:hypothetical protein